MADGGDGVDQLNGRAAADILIGGAGQDDSIDNDGRDRGPGRAGDETIISDTGGDVFYFTPSYNNDMIFDLKIMQNLTCYNFATFVFEELNISKSSGGLLISTPECNSSTLLGFAEGSLPSSNFLIFA